MKPFVNSWVIDFGAMNHMICSSHKVNNYNPYPISRKIAIVDGSLTSIAGVHVQFSPTLTLRDMLHVLKLSTNLVFIQKLT